MKTVRVDFSQGLRGGLVRANLRRASEPLTVGDEVEAIDQEEGLAFTGRVDRIDDDGRFAYLEMYWQDAATGGSPFTYDVPFSVAQAVVANISGTYRMSTVATGMSQPPSPSIFAVVNRFVAPQREVYGGLWSFIEEAGAGTWPQESSTSEDDGDRHAEPLQMMLAR